LAGPMPWAPLLTICGSSDRATDWADTLLRRYIESTDKPNTKHGLGKNQDRMLMSSMSMSTLCERPGRCTVAVLVALPEHQWTPRSCPCGCSGCEVGGKCARRGAGSCRVLQIHSSCSSKMMEEGAVGGARNAQTGLATSLSTQTSASIRRGSERLTRKKGTWRSQQPREHRGLKPQVVSDIRRVCSAVWLRRCASQLKVIVLFAIEVCKPARHSTTSRTTRSKPMIPPDMRDVMPVPSSQAAISVHSVISMASWCPLGS
jgi:hypothetical protein